MAIVINFLLLLLGKRKIIKISGDSMNPTYHDGDLLFLNTNAYRQKRPAIRDVIVIRHPFIKDMLLVKRLLTLTKDGKLFILSDNPDFGTDSRSFGALALDRVEGKIAGRYR